MIAGTIHAALVKAGAPIVGVSIGKADDKKTWRIDFAEDATDKQKADAQAAVDSFDVEVERAKPEPPTLEQRVAALEAAQAKK